MARVHDVGFTRRYNLGNFEHEEFSLAAQLDEGDDPLTVMASLKAQVAAAYGGETVSAPAEAVEEAPAPAKRGRKKKEEPVAEEAEEAEEEAEEEEAEEEEAEEEEAEEEAEEPAPKKKKFKSKAQTYSRANEQHKELFSKLLGAVAPDWKKSDLGKSKAKLASTKMEGKDFLDADGEIMDSFKADVKVLMSKKS